MIRKERKRLPSNPKILKNPLSFQLSRLRHHIRPSASFLQLVRVTYVKPIVTSGDLLFVALLTSCHAMNSPNLEC